MFFDKLVPVGRRHSYFDGGQEAGFLVKITGNNICHQALGDRPALAAISASLCLLVGG